ncbi:hypothetical protein GCM10028777_27720 [Angustibacter speluncae]
MDLDDTLRDRLSAAATTTTTRPLRPASTVRRSAERHRARRRGAAAVAVVATAAVAVALGTSLGPQLLSAPPAQDPTPSVTEEVTPPPTTDPSPTTPPTQTETEAPPPPTVTQEQAAAFVESFRFEDEDSYNASTDFPPLIQTVDTRMQAFGCVGEQAVPGALATRLVVAPGPDTSIIRQLGVYASTAVAAETFSTLRATMRACHNQPYVYDDGQRVTETQYVGGQLELGDESFWVGQKILVTSAADQAEVGQEQFFAGAALLVLDGTTISYLEDPTWTDAGRAEFVENATAEWERLRPQLAPVMPS